jgi:hypothetical protein
MDMKRLLKNIAVRRTIISSLVAIGFALYISTWPHLGEEKWPSLTNAAMLYQFRNHPDMVIIPPADIALATEILRQTEALWAEFLEFKDNSDLRQIRFAENTRYGDWMGRLWLLIEALPPKKTIGSDIYQLPLQLQIVAYDTAGRPIGCYEPTMYELNFREYCLPMARQAVNEDAANH